MKELIFHLAIPVASLETSIGYYEKLGCQLSRKYSDRATFNFFGDQLVCHLAPDQTEKAPRMYPRHFGITFTEKVRYDSTLKRALETGLTFFKRPFLRFKGLPEEHETFFLVDPSNNLIEFKYYKNPEMSY